MRRPLRLDDKNEPEPDISILKFRSDFYSGVHPESIDVIVAIEVFNTTIKYDKGVKLSLYASSGIPSYWIIDIEANHIIVHTKPKGSTYLRSSTYTFDDELELLGKPIQVRQIITQPNS